MKRLKILKIIPFVMGFIIYLYIMMSGCNLPSYAKEQNKIDSLRTVQIDLIYLIDYNEKLLPPLKDSVSYYRGLLTQMKWIAEDSLHEKVLNLAYKIENDSEFAKKFWYGFYHIPKK